MFKKAPKHPQTDLLNSVEQHLDDRRRKVLHDPNGWQNSFYREIFLTIDESVFKPMYHSHMGAPNALVNQLVAMMILKDGMGLSDEQSFEACRFHLLYRQALECVNLSDRIPTESTYYKFRSDVQAYQREYQVDLFGKVFNKIMSDQVIRFGLSGKQIRMDSKFIGSNIAFYSRFQLVHATMMLFYSDLSEQDRSDMPDELVRQMQQITDEDAESMIYRNSCDQIQDKFIDLGRRMQQLLDCYSTDQSRHYELLERVVNEQFVIQLDSGSESGDDEGAIISRPAAEIPAGSVQSPYDPERSYRRKAGKQVKGYSLNVTETIEDDQLNLITDIQLEPANCGDADFVEPSITQTEKLTGDQVGTCYADGAYNRSLEQEDTDDLDHVEMVLSGIQGAPSRFELEETSDGVEVSDTGQVHQGIPVRRRDPNAAPRGRITLEGGTYRSFGQCEILASKQRRLLAEQGHRERTRRRNNVEASIYHLAHTLKQAKTVYRGSVRTKIWAWGRALWVNMRRIKGYLEEVAPSSKQYAG